MKMILFTGGTMNLATPDVAGTIAMSSTAGKITLVNSTSAISGACPTTVIDIMGYRNNTALSTSCVPTAPAITNTTSDSRTGLFVRYPASGYDGHILLADIYRRREQRNLCV